MCLNFIILCIILVNEVFGVPGPTTYQSLMITSQTKCPSLVQPILVEHAVLKKCDSVDSKLLEVTDLSKKTEDAVLCYVYLSVFDHLCENVGKDPYQSADLSIAITKNLKGNIDDVCSSLGTITDSVLKHKFIISALQSPQKCDRLCGDYDEVKEFCSLATFMWTFSKALDEQKKPEALQTQKSRMTGNVESTNDKKLQPPTNKNIGTNENQESDKLSQPTLNVIEDKNEVDQLPSKKSPSTELQSETIGKHGNTALNKDNGENLSPNTVSNIERDKASNEANVANFSPTYVSKSGNDKTLNEASGINVSPNTGSNLKNDKPVITQTVISPPESLDTKKDLTIPKSSAPNSMKTTQLGPSEGSLSRPGTAPETKIELNKNQQTKQLSPNLDKDLNIDHKKEENKSPIQNNEAKDTTGQVKGKEVKKENDNKDQIDETLKEEYDDDGDELVNEEPENKDDKEKDNKEKSPLTDLNIYEKEPPPKPSEVKEKLVEISKPRETDEDSLNVAANYQNQNIDDSNSYFFSYFMMVCVMFICGYVAYHNKQKILALVLEGRKSRRPSRSRRPNSANYRKLDTTLEEAVTSSCNKNTTQVIY